MPPWCFLLMKTEIQLRSIRGLLLVPAAALLMTPAFADTPSARIGAAAPVFHLKDQFDHETSLEDFKGSVVVIVCGDRRGGDYMNDWAKAVNDNYKDPPGAVTVLRIADLVAVPPFFHSYAKQRFLSKNAEGRSARPTLLDWDALVPKLYGFTNDVTNVYVIDAQGVLRYKASGKGTPDEIRNLIHALEDVRQQAVTSSDPERKQP